MSNTIYAFTLSTLAGLSTLLGFLPILFNLKDEKKIILSSLAFASGVMITVSFIDLIPESYHLLTTTFKNFPALLFLLIFLVIGIIFSILIDKFLPSTDSSQVTIFIDFTVTYDICYSLEWKIQFQIGLIRSENS